MSKPFTVTLKLPSGQERSLRVEAERHILDVAYEQGLDLPSMCLQGWCLTCAARVEGPGEWDQSDSRRYFRSDREAGFILPCTAKPRSDLTLRTHQRVAMRDRRLKLGLPAPMA
jgi:ferredoxin